MNLLVEEDFDTTKLDHYMQLTKRYFDESYAKFSNNAEYLFYTGITAVMSEWYFGIDTDDYLAMLDKAIELEPHNPLYQRSYYINLDHHDPKYRQKVYQYAKLVLEKNSPIQKLLSEKGAIGAYLMGLMIYRAKDIINDIENPKK